VMKSGENAGIIRGRVDVIRRRLRTAKWVFLNPRSKNRGIETPYSS